MYKVFPRNPYSTECHTYNKTNTKPRFPDSFNINSEYITDKAKITTEFNKYFAEIGETISSNVTKTDTKYSDFLKH